MDWNQKMRLLERSTAETVQLISKQMPDIRNVTHAAPMRSAPFAYYVTFGKDLKDDHVVVFSAECIDAKTQWRCESEISFQQGRTLAAMDSLRIEKASTDAEKEIDEWIGRAARFLHASLVTLEDALREL